MVKVYGVTEPRKAIVGMTEHRNLYQPQKLIHQKHRETLPHGCVIVDEIDTAKVPRKITKNMVFSYFFPS